MRSEVSDSYCWNEWFFPINGVDLRNGDFTIQFKVYDSDDNGDDYLGQISKSSSALSYSSSTALTGGPNDCLSTVLSYEFALY